MILFKKKYDHSKCNCQCGCKVKMQMLNDSEIHGRICILCQSGDHWE